MLKTFDKKEAALWLSGLLGFAVPAYYAVEIYRANTTPNMATWLLIFFLDFTGLWLSFMGGNKKPYIQIAWFTGAVFIMLAVSQKPNTWTWGEVETMSALMCILAVLVWVKVKTKKRATVYGLILQSVAVYISFIPQIKDYCLHPDPGTWYLWLGTIVASGAAIYAAEKKDAAHTLIPWAAIILNTGILILILE